MRGLSKLRKEGFTIIELIVVIAILGILLAVAVLNLEPVIGNARSTADEQNLRILETSIAAYKSSNNSLPASVTNKATFVTAFSSVLPEGIPDVNRSGYKFYYNTSDGNICCETASPGVDWINVSD